MNRRFRVLVNPSSGTGRSRVAAGSVTELLRQAGAAVSVVDSRGAEHCRVEVADAAARGEVVVACGGDGMLASVGGAVVASDAVLGIIPSGRGNDFARMLGLASDPRTVAATLLTGEPARVDVIDVDGRVVLGSVYAGVDSLASELVDRAHRLPARVQYPYAAVRALLTHRPTTYHLSVDGRTRTVEAYSVVVANSAYYGKGMRIAPSARVDDGLLDVVVLPSASRFRLVRLMPKVYDGSHAELEEVLTVRGRTVTVSAADPVPAYGDGEPVTTMPFTATVVPGALRVLIRGPASPKPAPVRSRRSAAPRRR